MKKTQTTPRSKEENGAKINPKKQAVGGKREKIRVLHDHDVQNCLPKRITQTSIFIRINYVKKPHRTVHMYESNRLMH